MWRSGAVARPAEPKLGGLVAVVCAIAASPHPIRSSATQAFLFNPFFPLVQRLEVPLGLSAIPRLAQPQSFPLNARAVYRCL